MQSLHSLKEQVHKLVDQATNTTALTEAAALLQAPADYLEQFSPEELATLDRALAQARLGQTISHIEAKQRLGL